MLTIQISCRCGHFAKITDEGVIESWKQCKPLRFRCGQCGQAEQSEARLAWDCSTNPMTAAYCFSTAPKD
jgi:hypothetical protein